MQASIADVRRLVEDLRPPALDQLGLVRRPGAARGPAHRARPRSVRSRGGAGLPALPAAVEVAAYRIAAEALTNVARHAAARQCLVRLTMDGGRTLAVRVEDDGVGCTATARLGVGLHRDARAGRRAGRHLRGRAEASGGTRVAARLPLGCHVIRVVLVDDHPVFRHGLTALLAATPEVEVVAEGATGARRRTRWSPSSGRTWW